MERKTRRTMKVSHIMANPHPKFVSIVDHGANQRGFDALKHVSAASGKDEDMSGLKGTVTKGKQNLDVAKVVFPKANFADEAAVKAHLTEAGFVVGTVEEDGDNWVVKADDFDQFGDLTEIEGDNKSTYFVGTLTPTEAKADAVADAVVDAPADTTADAPVIEDAAPAAEPTYFAPGFTGTEELTAKYSGWITEYSEGKTLTSVLSSGADGLPPGIYELNTAFYTALRNNLIAGDYEGARAVTTEYGNLVIELSKVLEAATVGGDLAAKSEMVGKAARDPDAPLEPVVDTTAPVETPAADGTENETTSEPAPASDDAPVSKKDFADFASMLAVSVGKAVADALAPVATNVQTAVEAVGTKTEEAVSELREEVSKTASRVEGLEGRTQTRKGVDDDAAHQQERKQEPVQRSVGSSNLLGFRRRPQ